MNIYIYVDDKNYSDVDLRNPQLGNPGVGGTPYCFALLIYFYKQYYPGDFIALLHNNGSNKWPKCDSEIVCKDVYDAAKTSKEADLFLFRFGLENDDLYSLFDELKLKAIGWQHNFPRSIDLDNLHRHEALKRMVFVGQPQMDKVIDHPAFAKCSVIENMFWCSPHHADPVSNKNVVYTGSLTPFKGFHLLAKSWKRITRECPDIQLYVIGDGSLYSKNIVLGEYGFVEREYEKSFINDILDDERRILPNIHFLGKLGVEKQQIYRECRIGIVNPAGTETLCLSALEMSSEGLPVVSKKKGGTLYSVQNGVTGLLFKNERQMIRAIRKILNNESTYRKMHENGPGFVEERFCPESICKKWNDLFWAVNNDKQTKHKIDLSNLFIDYKWLRLLNRFFVKTFGAKPLISRSSHR